MSGTPSIRPRSSGCRLSVIPVCFRKHTQIISIRKLFLPFCESSLFGMPVEGILCLRLPLWGTGGGGNTAYLQTGGISVGIIYRLMVFFMPSNGIVLLSDS